jgi:hypothetical protein
MIPVDGELAGPFTEAYEGSRLSVERFHKDAAPHEVERGDGIPC